MFIGSGKLGFPARAVMAFSMGVDCINVAREAMMSIGCIQAKLCHTNACPSGVATQSKWKQRGIDVDAKSIRTHYYFKNFRKELLEMTHAAGYEHPSQFTMDDVEMATSDKEMINDLSSIFKYNKKPVLFNGISSLQNCEHLGGGYSIKTEKKVVKEALKEDNVRY